jgi:hypothetical protein
VSVIYERRRGGGPGVRRVGDWFSRSGLSSQWDSPGELHPQAPLRTRRERLRSPGSHHPTASAESDRPSAPPGVPVDRRPILGGPRPWLHSHYRSFLATTARSAPVAPPRYSPPLGCSPLGFSLSVTAGQPGRFQHRTTGSHVPHESLDQARAACMPDATWAVGRYLPGFSRGKGLPSVLTSTKFFSTLPRRFTFVRLLGPHLTHAMRLFRSAHHPGS